MTLASFIFDLWGARLACHHVLLVEARTHLLLVAALLADEFLTSVRLAKNFYLAPKLCLVLASLLDLATFERHFRVIY